MRIRKEDIYMNLQASIGDFASIKYQMQWQRVSQMQQNASILLAIITFSITLLFQIINIEKYGKPILENGSWNIIILPGIFSSLMIGVISSIFLFKVIMPKTVKKDLPIPEEIYKELLQNIEKSIVKSVADDSSCYEYDELHPIRFIAGKISERYSSAVIEISEIVEKNQMNYFKGLIISVFSISINIFLYMLIMINYELLGATKIIWYGMCLSLFVTSLLLPFVCGKNKIIRQENTNEE
jgi:hypothetical protein